MSLVPMELGKIMQKYRNRIQKIVLTENSPKPCMLIIFFRLQNVSSWLLRYTACVVNNSNGFVIVKINFIRMDNKLNHTVIKYTI